MGADPDRFRERLGEAGPDASGGVIWFHGASLGEIMQIGPLVRKLRERRSEKVLVTTATAAGADWVTRHLPFVEHRYVPLDTPGSVCRFLDAWKPVAAIFIEGDLWPRLVLTAAERHIPLVLLNARHSRSRERFPGVFGALLSHFAVITCRADPIADGILALAVPADRVRRLPDLRMAAEKLAAPSEAVAQVSEAIGARPVWMAASTHPDDEGAVITAQKHVLESLPDALLVLAPRHPRRARAVLDAAKSAGLSVAQRSAGDGITPETQVYLADTLGELGIFFALSKVAFLGGSFGSEGGHNPYEPARFGIAILSGPNVKNFADAYQALADAGAARLVAPDALGRQVTDLLAGDGAEEMGQAALAFATAGAEGVDDYVDVVVGVLPPDVA